GSARERCDGDLRLSSLGRLSEILYSRDPQHAEVVRAISLESEETLALSSIVHQNRIQLLIVESRYLAEDLSAIISDKEIHALGRTVELAASLCHTSWLILVERMKLHQLTENQQLSLRIYLAWLDRVYEDRLGNDIDGTEIGVETRYRISDWIQRVYLGLGIFQPLAKSLADRSSGGAAVENLSQTSWTDALDLSQWTYEKSRVSSPDRNPPV